MPGYLYLWWIVLLVLPMAACTGQRESSHTGKSQDQIARPGNASATQAYGLTNRAMRAPLPHHPADTLATREDQLRAGIGALRVRVSPAMVGGSTSKMLVTNPNPTRVDFTLRCFTRRGTTRTLEVTVPPGGQTRIGELQAWSGHFSAGERCEALFRGEVVWTVSIP